MRTFTPKTIDCRKSGGWPKDLSPSELPALIALSDMWPGDKFVFAFETTVRLAGDGFWEVIDEETGRIHRARGLQWKA